MKDGKEQQEQKDRVGYKNPPKSGQFKPGTSGNPSGRPKRDPNAHVIANGDELRRVLLRMLNKKIDVLVGGKKVSKTVLEAIFQQWIATALKGNVKAGKEIYELAAAFYEIEDEIQLKFYQMLLDLEDARETPHGLEESRARFYRKRSAERKKNSEAELHDEYQPLTDEEWKAYNSCLEGLKADPDAETWQDMIVRIRAKDSP